MVDIITPSTGERRPGGDMRMNVRGFAPGQRVLVRTDFGGWDAFDVLAVGEAGITLGRDGKSTGVATFRDIAASIPARVDEAALVANMRAMERRGDEGIAAARKAKSDGLRGLLDGVGLERVAPFIPGM